MDCGEVGKVASISGKGSNVCSLFLLTLGHLDITIFDY